MAHGFDNRNGSFCATVSSCAILGHKTPFQIESDRVGRSVMRVAVPAAAGSFEYQSFFMLQANLSLAWQVARSALQPNSSSHSGHSAGAAQCRILDSLQ